MSTCLQTELPVSLGMTRRVGFLDQYHCYKSVATQIPHDAGLAPIPDTGQKNPPLPGIKPASHLLL